MQAQNNRTELKMLGGRWGQLIFGIDRKSVV